MPLTVLSNGHLALQFDQITYVALIDIDSAGNPVPMKAGDVATVATSGANAASVTPAVTTMPGTSNPAISFTCNVKESDASNGGVGIGIVLSDSAGLPMTAATSALLFDVVADLTPTAEGLDLTTTATAPNPTPPTAPGP